jgi:phosphatidylserine decarboxylase
MKIHKEGYSIIFKTFIIIAVAIAVLYFILGYTCLFKIITLISLFLFLFITNFFRSPKRTSTIDAHLVMAPADGKVVAIKEVEENEYLKTKCIQVSIFMSIFNVHVNYYPISGKIVYSKYHEGNYLIACHPKSSEKNERTSIVVESANNGKKILFRQIAGYIARRIVCYAEPDNQAVQCNQVGFIKFGSRIDLFLPLDTEVVVKSGQKVRACETIIAKI